MYGAAGQHSSIFYNLHVAGTIAGQSRSCISAAGLFFEMFLANNVKYSCLNDIITFIHNTISERPERQFIDYEILDKNINHKQCFYKVMMTSGFNYVPDEEDMDIVWNMICNLDQEDINRLYYKNNLYAFVENTKISNMVIDMLTKLESPFLEPSVKTVPPEIKNTLTLFCDILKEYVYYGYQIMDRVERYENMVRSVCVITDTDSCIISLDAWYRYILNKVGDKELLIKRIMLDVVEYTKADEFGDRPLTKPIEYLEDNTDYDFYEDDIVALEKSINPIKVIPQECLRYSIINIMAYCIDNYINDYMTRYAVDSNTHRGDRKCLLIMKNEFLFKRVLLRDVMKNYASIQELKEGNPVPKDKSLDVKGLSMDKSGLSSASRERLRKILYEEILSPEVVDQSNVVKALAKFEKEIYNKIMSGSKEYYKPARVKSMNSYDDPMGQQGIKAMVVYNALRADNEPAINLEERNSIDIAKVNINKNTLAPLKDTNPEMYEKITDLMRDKAFTKEIKSIAIPKDMYVPEWLLEFIDYKTIISDNTKHLPIEAIGVYRGRGTNSYTNIVKI